MTVQINGQHKIKDRLSSADLYFKKFQNQYGKIPFDMEEWIKPKISKRLLDDVDDSIITIASKISRKVRSKTEDKLLLSE